jgi:hypothetical protein
LNTNPDYKSQIQFNIPDAIVMDDSIEYIHFSIPYVIIPNSFYTINQTNNILVIVENDVTTNYAFPYGNYNSDTFIAMWNSVLPGRFSLFINPVTNIFTITNNTYAFQIVDLSIDYIMGFSQNMTSTGSVMFQIVMTRPCNFLPTPRINLRCSLLANSIMTESTNSTDVILLIPNSGAQRRNYLSKCESAKVFIQVGQAKQLHRFHNRRRWQPYKLQRYKLLLHVSVRHLQKVLVKPPDFHKTVKMVNENSNLE